jgi:hypothetical protein
LVNSDQAITCKSALDSDFRALLFSGQFGDDQAGSR